MYKLFTKKIFALLTAATMVLSAPAISAGAVSSQGDPSQQTPSAAAKPYVELLEKIESLPAPHGSVTYKYVFYEDRTPVSGKYLIVATKNSALFSSVSVPGYVSQQSYFTRFSDNNTVILEKDIIPECVFTFEKEDDKYYIRDYQGRYLSLHRTRQIYL